MEIKNVTIIGIGALGILYGHQLSTKLPEENLRVVADAHRIERYKRDKIYCNDQECRFNFVTPEEDCPPADLLIFAVKNNGLHDAINSVKKHIGPNTIILSLLNGISSEEIIGEAYGMEKVLYCVAQGMDAVRAGNKLSYQDMGILCFGGSKAGEKSDKIQAVSDFFTKNGVPHLVVEDMRHKLWGKFMLNVGLNQTVAVFECNYSGIQEEGPARNTMIEAMREVMVLAEKENVSLTEEDLNYWMAVLENMNPEGKPSMRQDMEAKRHSEVEMFAGTVLKKGQKYGLNFPVNQMLYNKIKEMERDF